ncbi:hypothetical protein Hanom_Chr03g00200601 [Helianthus anomalus]
MFSIVRSSQRLIGNMYKSRFKNTFEKPLVCSDSETSNNEDKGICNVVKSINKQKTLHYDPDDDFVDTPPGKRPKSVAKRIPNPVRHQTMSQPYQPFTGSWIRAKVSIDKLIRLALGLNDKQ